MKLTHQRKSKTSNQDYKLIFGHLSFPVQGCAFHREWPLMRGLGEPQAHAVGPGLGTRPAAPDPGGLGPRSPHRPGLAKVDPRQLSGGSALGPPVVLGGSHSGFRLILNFPWFPC